MWTQFVAQSRTVILFLKVVILIIELFEMKITFKMFVKDFDKV